MLLSSPVLTPASGSFFLLGLCAAIAAIALAVLGRRHESPFIRARPRGLPFVHSTIRVARSRSAKAKE